MLLAQAAAHAQLLPWSRVDEGDKPWVEAESRLPPYPRTETLVQFDPDDAAIPRRNRYYIDPDSISIGKDEVVRYTLMIRSAGGAANVSHEGIRCLTREHRVYAYGRPDRSWAPVPNNEWRWIGNEIGSRLQRVLYYDYFCPGQRHPVSSVKEAITRLKKGPPPVKFVDE